jgi:hypothetical protein
MNPDRRRLLEKGLAVAAVAVVGIGTGCQASPTKRNPIAPSESDANPSNRASWTPWIPPLAVGGSFDLADTLPPNVPRGGWFGLDDSGGPLPAGLSLSPAGILSVRTAGVGSVNGVIFTYDTP